MIVELVCWCSWCWKENVFFYSYNSYKTLEVLLIYRSEILLLLINNIYPDLLLLLAWRLLLLLLLQYFSMLKLESIENKGYLKEIDPYENLFGTLWKFGETYSMHLSSEFNILNLSCLVRLSILKSMENHKMMLKQFN